MLLRCGSCQSEFVAEGRSQNGPYVCPRCLEQMHGSSRKSLGIHPALQKKYDHRNTMMQKKPASRIILRDIENTVISPFTSHMLKNRLKEHYTKIDSHPETIPKKGPPKQTVREAKAGHFGLPKIPGYELEYQIGKGAMGSVFRARHLMSGQLAAIKVLSRDLSSRFDLVARFEREAAALRTISHPNVVSILDSGCVDETHYFCMEFVDGMTLRTRLNRGLLPWEEAIFIVREILRGLQVAHAHGIIHRDLKPENVLLAYENHQFHEHPQRVVVVDFGLVGIGKMALDPHPNLTRSRVTMGTVNYMAPEQHMDAKRVDQRSDLYSCGVILYECLTGDLPLGRYMMPKEKGMYVPPELDGLLLKALARTEEERFQNAQEFELCLAAIVKAHVLPKEKAQTKPDASSMAKVSSRGLRFFSRSSLKIGAGFLACVLFLAVGIFLSRSQREEVSKPDLPPGNKIVIKKHTNSRK